MGIVGRPIAQIGNAWQTAQSLPGGRSKKIR
jgi:hypothetical protein